MTRMKLAELTSGVGALVMGVGLGALFPRWLSPTAGLITIVGLTLHGFGMWDKHRLESLDNHGAGPGWVVVALYWTCWLLLIVVLSAVLVAALRSSA